MREKQRAREKQKERVWERIGRGRALKAAVGQVLTIEAGGGEREAEG